MYKLNVIACCSIFKRFLWEVYIYLNNLREHNLSDKAHILVFIPYSALEKNLEANWDKIKADFPEVKFVFFRDEENFEKLCTIFGYIPLFRPHILAKYYKEHPELSKEAVFYTDTDIQITKYIHWPLYLNDDVVYISDAKSYTNHDYFDSKRRTRADGTPEFVQPVKYEEFLKRDILAECAAYCNIDRAKVEENVNSSGAAQYLLKGVDEQFWLDVVDACINIKSHMAAINQEYMQGAHPGERENNGYQSWCADIHATVWNLWRRNIITLTPKDFDFSWATDEVGRWEETSIFHNAGVTAESTIRTLKKDEKGKNIYVDAPVFYKGKGIYCSDTITPFEDMDYINEILNHPVSREYCSWKYTQAIKQTKENYNL